MSRRLYECLYVHKFSDISSSILSALFASSYYFFVPLTSVELLFNAPTKALPNLPKVLLITIFLSTNYLQFKSHSILANLRQSKTKEPQYSIPRGFLFEYVSSPHYLCEIVAYLCLWILHFQNVSLFLVFIFVVGNQVDLSLQTQSWYKSKFGSSFPKKRKAIIPFLL